MQADWKIVERGWHAHVLGEAEHKSKSALEAIKKLRVRQEPMKEVFIVMYAISACRAPYQCKQCISHFGRSSSTVRHAHSFLL